MAIAGKVAILPKGEWDSAVTYEKLDAVSYDNALYMAKKQSVGQVPTDGEYWMFCLQSIDYAEFEKIINGTTTVGIADKAINDKNGDDIVDTYAKKDDLTNFQNKDGDSKDNIVTFTSADDTTADVWTDVAVLATGEKHSSLLAKISTMFKNIRYIYTHFIKSENILETLEEIVANTQSGKVAGALAVKELNSNLNDIDKKTTWKFLKSSTTKIISDIQKCEELYIMVYPNHSAVCYEFIVPWISIRSGTTLYLNNGYGFGSSNNFVRISHTKSSEKATIKLEACYENNVSYIDESDIWVYYR